MDQQTAFASWQALLAGNDLAGLTIAAPAMEAVSPVTQPQWEQMRAIFNVLQRPAWVEIMTERFLRVEPFNLAARLEQVALISLAPQRHDEALRKAEALLDMPFDQAGHFLQLGKIFANCAAAEPAAKWLRRALQAEPENLAIRVGTVQAFLQMGKPAEAKVELVNLRAIARGRVGLLLAASTMALWINDPPFALETYKEAEAALGPDNHEERGQLLTQAVRLGRFDDVARHVSLTDFRQLRSVSLLGELYLALEGRGFYDAERQIVAAALALSPTDPKFQDRARLLAARRIDLFPAATPQASPPASRAMRDRLRDLMFWR